MEMDSNSVKSDSAPAQQPAKSAPQPAPAPQPQAQQAPMGQPMMNQSMMGGQPMMMNQPMMGQPVNVQPAQFTAFSPGNMGAYQPENIDLIMDVPLEVTVELGRTTKSISDILDFGPGKIIELNKIAGEPIDVLVNGKYVAKGEVVVIEESFGVRITEIVNATKLGQA
jgi:flagellar motor switch protein FliN/FliY